MKLFNIHALLICLLMVITFVACKKPIEVVPPHVGQNEKEPFELVVYANSEDKAEIQKWLDDMVSKYDAEITYPCKECDSTIIVLSGSNLPTYASPELPPKIKGSGDPIGYASYNFKTFLPEISDTANQKRDSVKYSKPPLNNDGITRVLTAILDTGIDPDISENYPAMIASPCLRGGEKGWNFVAGNPNTLDDYRGSTSQVVGHGDPVARYIIEEAAIGNVVPQLLPVKIFDQYGGGTLDQLLCGIIYAVKAGAKVINLSGGFYAYTPAQTELLKQVLKDWVEKNGVTLVAAAGNVVQQAIDYARAQQGTSYSSFANDDFRNLDKFGFYPAAFSNTTGMEHLYAVTTIQMKIDPYSVSPGQNFSSRHVDVGIDCDEILPGDKYAFADNWYVPKYWRFGSSFATPIFTGKLLAHHNAISTFSKNDVISHLETKEVIKKNPVLSAFICKGYTSHRR